MLCRCPVSSRWPPFGPNSDSLTLSCSFPFGSGTDDLISVDEELARHDREIEDEFGEGANRHR
jgi:hypothetical protein